MNPIGSSTNNKRTLSKGKSDKNVNLVEYAF